MMIFYSHSIISGTVEPAWILGSRRKALANTVTNTVSRAMLSIHAGFRAISKKRALNYYWRLLAQSLLFCCFNCYTGRLIRL